VFQDSIFQASCLGRCFKLLIKEKAGLYEQKDVAKSLISSIFEEETSFLNADGTFKLKEHYMACCWQMMKDFLDYYKDFMTQVSYYGIGD
jgi:hypothetical protein